MIISNEGQLIEDQVPVPSYTLNAEQQDAFDWLYQFCTGVTEVFRWVLLQGYAGTGKSFMLTKMIEAVKKKWPMINFGITAPTHKAVRVLKKQSELRDQLDFGTIHSFLSLKQKHNEQTGEVTYEPDFRPNGQLRRIDGVHVLIVDESSMLDDKLFEYLMDEIRNNHRLRIIFCGDSLQIPPVGKKEKVLNEINAIPFVPERRKSHKIHLLELIKPQRQAADSPIIMYAHAIREQIEHQSIDFEFRDEYKHALELVPSKGNVQGMRELIQEYFLSGHFDEDTDYCKFISYTNKTAIYFNKLVREMKHNSIDIPHLLMEDKLIMEQPIISRNSVVIAKNDDVVLTHLETVDIDFRYDIIEKGTFSSGGYDPLSDISKSKRIQPMKAYKVRVCNEEGREVGGMIVHESSMADYELIREKVRQAALNNNGFDRKNMWQEWYRIEGAFIWVSHNYAITAHKSQGSSYNFAISQEWDIDRLRFKIGYEEANRIRYVAATRAKNKLFVVR